MDPWYLGAIFTWLLTKSTLCSALLNCYHVCNVVFQKDPDILRDQSNSRLLSCLDKCLRTTHIIIHIYVLKVCPSFQVISFTVHAFDVEFHSKCQFDKLEYYDGGQLDSTSLTFCGDHIPDIPSSSSDTVVFVFTSDGYAHRSGFFIVYTAVNSTTLERMSSQSVTTHIFTGKQCISHVSKPYHKTGRFDTNPGCCPLSSLLCTTAIP